jgi:hypothetical protein
MPAGQVGGPLSGPIWITGSSQFGTKGLGVTTVSDRYQTFGQPANLAESFLLRERRRLGSESEPARRDRSLGRVSFALRHRRLCGRSPASCIAIPHKDVVAGITAALQAGALDGRRGGVGRRPRSPNRPTACTQRPSTMAPRRPTGRHGGWRPGVSGQMCQPAPVAVCLESGGRGCSGGGNNHP